MEILNAEIKSNIGEVTEGVDKASTATKELSKNTKDAGESAKKAGKGFGTLVKSLGIIGLLAAAFKALKEAMGQNQRVIDILNTAMTSVSIVFNDFFKFIEGNIGTIIGYFKALFEDPGTKVKELGDAIKQGLVDRFNEFLEVMGLVGKAFGELIRGEFGQAFDSIKEAGKQTVDVWTGVDDSFEKVTETIKGYVTETINQAVAITETTKAAGRAAVEFAKLNAQFLKEAEEQRQIRDDETKTFAERIAANNELNKILEKQQKLQREQVQIGIDAAQLQYNNNKSEENWLALQTEKNAMLELEEAITGQLSEQKTNQVSLEKELGEVKNEVLLEGLEGIELELSELKRAYELKLLMADKAGMDDAAITAKYEKEKAGIVKSYQKEVVKWSEMSSDEQLGIASDTAGQMATIMGEQTEAGKAFAIIQATIDTFASAQAAYKAVVGIYPVGPVLAPIAAAAAVAAGMANIRAIQGAGGGGGGGGGGISAGGGAPAAAPPSPQMMSGSFDLTGGEAIEPTRAYVVSDDITNSQNGLEIIRRRATI